MGLKKGYFKNLKGGVNNSPIKFHDGTQHSIDPPNKRRPNVQIDNTRVNNKFNFNKSNDFKLEQERLSELDNKRRNKVNEDFRKARLDQMKEKYPNASEAELKKLFIFKQTWTYARTLLVKILVLAIQVLALVVNLIWV